MHYRAHRTMKEELGRLNEKQKGIVAKLKRAGQNIISSFKQAVAVAAPVGREYCRQWPLCGDTMSRVSMMNLRVNWRLV